MKEHIDQFIYFMTVERGVSKNTIQAYRRDLLKLASYFEKLKIKLNSAKRETIVDFMMSLKDKGLGDNSISRNLAAIKTFWKFLVAERVTEDNVASLVETPRVWKNIPEVLNK
ncbi:MAG: site-specific integrase, partial [Candidatus Omnitrophica bacterium]|nr:site-specific integrase [Candidatus Omnitrophota bacterium]